MKINIISEKKFLLPLQGSGGYMVVKGHGGNIEVNSKEGEFTEFTITLPL